MALFKFLLRLTQNATEDLGKACMPFVSKKFPLRSFPNVAAEHFPGFFLNRHVFLRSSHNAASIVRNFKYLALVHHTELYNAPKYVLKDGERFVFKDRSHIASIISYYRCTRVN